MNKDEPLIDGLPKEYYDDVCMYVVVDMYQLWHSLQPFLKWVSLIFLVLLYRLDDCSFLIIGYSNLLIS